MCELLSATIWREYTTKMGDASNIQMHDVVAMLQQLRQENANLRNAMEQLQVAHVPVHVPVP